MNDFTITATAHVDCPACDATASAASAYAEAGGSSVGTFRSSLVDGGPHWATITCDTAAVIS